MTQPRAMTGRTVLVTGGTGGIGKATAAGLAALGARVAITGRDRRRADEAAADDPRRRRPAVDVFVADMSSQAEVRRLAAEVLDGLPAARRPGEQRRRLLGAPTRHRRRARAHLRAQPPRPVPADPPAARPAEGERPGPGGHGLLRRAGHGPDRLRRPPGRARLLRASAPTTSPSWPTCSSPTSSPDVWRAAASPPTCCTPASSARRSAPRTRAPSSGCSSRSPGRS